MTGTTNSGMKLVQQVIKLIEGMKPGETVEIKRPRGRGRRYTTRVRRDKALASRRGKP